MLLYAYLIGNQELKDIHMDNSQISLPYPQLFTEEIQNGR